MDSQEVADGADAKLEETPEATERNAQTRLERATHKHPNDSVEKFQLPACTLRYAESMV